MVVPKRRHSHSRQGKRRANWKLKALNVAECPKCHEAILPHHACPVCGTYQGRQVIKIEEKKGKEKKEKVKEKGKEKKANAQEKKEKTKEKK